MGKDTKHQIISVDNNISLTRILRSDIPSLVKFINDPSIYENTLTIPFPYTEDDGNQYLDMVFEFESKHQLQKDWAIRDGELFIGAIGLLYNYGIGSHKSEIGYWIARKYRGKGIMTKVLQRFVAFCFEKLGLRRIEASVFLHNPASGKALMNAGFTYECIQKKTYLKKDKLLDAHRYAVVSQH